MSKTFVYGTGYVHAMPYMDDRVRKSSISHIKNNVPPLVSIHAFRYTKSIMVRRARRREQRQLFLKAKVALALYRAYGRVPKENEIDEVYHVTRLLKALLGSPFVRKQHKHTGQLALF